MRLFTQLTTLVFLFLSFSMNAQDSYTMTIESSEPVATTGTTYRFYANMLDATDRFSAVYGHNISPITISAPAGVFNSAGNSSWSASGINPAFLSFFPDMVDDTYATIGLEGPASSSGIADSVDPSLVEDSSQPITPFFIDAGATNLEINTLTGASYYVLNTASNGLPNDDMRVLIMQITTAGSLSGIINFQVFPLGVGVDAIYVSANFSEGGVDVLGCMTALACNYNPDATVDDGSCDFVSCLVFGCMDMAACNYDADAEYPDGSCTYAEAPYDCNGDCVEDTDGDGICDVNETFGCLDSEACNYNASATDDDGTCTYADAPYNCDGGCVNDVNANGICDEFEGGGCTDVLACNYNIAATEDDGTCEYCSCEGALQASYGLDVDVVMEHTDGSLAGQTTYRLFVTTPNADDFLSAVYGDGDDQLNISSTTSFFQHVSGDVLGSGMQPNFYEFLPELEYDSWVTIGLEQGAEEGESAPSTVASPNFNWVTEFENGSDLEINDAIGGSWFVLDSSTSSNAFSDENQRILVAQLTTDGTPSGAIWVQMFNHGDNSDVTRVELTFNGTTGTQTPTCGCTDMTACNYEDEATSDDGSCTYPDSALVDCSGECVNDADGDGICDENEVMGCTDMVACDYDADATDDGACDYADSGYDCNGDCLVDTDADGVCDEFEIVGCQDVTACDYNADSTDSGDCTYPATGYDCAGDCLNDTDSDGVCDEFEVDGCTDMIACNYDALATELDDSCTYADVGYDCAGVCLADADADGVCDEFEVVGCQDMAACDYNADATDEGSCVFAIAGYDCNGDCLADADTDGVCDEFEVVGCQDMAACDYNADATDAGDCDYTSCLGCTDSAATNYDMNATQDDGSCCYLVISVETSDALCYDGQGTITATVAGAEGTVTYTLDEESNETGEFTVDPGTYTVTATDSNANMCSSSLLVMVMSGVEMTISASATDATAAGALGVGTATATGGNGDYTFVWTDAEGNVVDASALAEGTYTVTVTDTNDCSVSTEVTVNVDGILDIDPLAFNMFPNPTTGAITLQVSTVMDDVNMLVLDATGRVVFTKSNMIVQGSTNFDFSNLSTGTYTIMLSNDNGMSVRRLSIQH